MPIGGRATRKKQQRADYILRCQHDFPIAVVETKAEYHHPVDFNVFLSQPVHFAGVRASHGITKDLYYETNLSALRGKIPLITYHFFEPVCDPLEQADLFYKITLGRGVDRLFVDLEQNGDPKGNNHTGRPYPAFPMDDYWDVAMQFIEYLDRRLPKKLGVYSSALFLNANTSVGLRSKALKKSLDANRPWWLAYYPSRSSVPPSESANVILPRFLSSNRGVIWQFWADGNQRAREFGASGSQSIDLDVLYGGRTEFLNIFGKEPRVAPIADDSVWPKRFITKGQVAIRTGPGEENMQAGWANAKTAWTVWGVENDARKRQWLRITEDSDPLRKYISGWNCTQG